MATDVTWSPTPSTYDWPPQTKALAGSTASYSTIPTRAQVNAGSGINQIVAALRNKANSSSCAYVAGLTDSASISAVKSGIDTLRTALGYGAYTWTASFAAGARMSLQGVYELRDAMPNDVWALDKDFSADTPFDIAWNYAEGKLYTLCTNGKIYRRDGRGSQTLVGTCTGSISGSRPSIIYSGGVIWAQTYSSSTTLRIYKWDGSSLTQDYSATIYAQGGFVDNGSYLFWTGQNASGVHYGKRNDGGGTWTDDVMSSSYEASPNTRINLSGMVPMQSYKWSGTSSLTRTGYTPGPSSAGAQTGVYSGKAWTAYNTSHLWYLNGNQWTDNGSISGHSFICCAGGNGRLYCSDYNSGAGHYAIGHYDGSWTEDFAPGVSLVAIETDGLSGGNQCFAIGSTKLFSNAP